MTPEECQATIAAQETARREMMRLAGTSAPGLPATWANIPSAPIGNPFGMPGSEVVGLFAKFLEELRQQIFHSQPPSDRAP